MEALGDLGLAGIKAVLSCLICLCISSDLPFLSARPVFRREVLRRLRAYLLFLKEKVPLPSEVITYWVEQSPLDGLVVF